MGLLYLYKYKVYHVVSYNGGNYMHSVGKQNSSVGFVLLVNFFLCEGGCGDLNLWP